MGKILTGLMTLLFLFFVTKVDAIYHGDTPKKGVAEDSTNTDDSAVVLEFESELYPSMPLEIVHYWQPSPIPLNHSFYEDNYYEGDLMYKIVDNYGNGCDELYGTRNVKAVLHGVAYRGGANNYYHRSDKRNNQNPLPDDGLKNLCKAGFSSVIYLYKTNFETAPESMYCDCDAGMENYLVYDQYDYYNEEHIHEMMNLVYKSATDDQTGPIYIHCWNGWHASGLISALILRQFCGYSAQDAVNYWDLGTDGNNLSPRYNLIRDQIRNFVPYPELTISDSIGNIICPEMPTIIDYSKLFIDIEQLVIVPEAIPTGYSITLTSVIFKPYKISLSNPQNNRELKLLLLALQEQPELNVEIGGHTDNTGKYYENLTLSKQRAKFVYDFLLKNGIDSTKISYKGYGSSKPKYSNHTSKGRAANRRIEVTIIANKEQPIDKLVGEEDSNPVISNPKNQ